MLEFSFVRVLSSLQPMDHPRARGIQSRVTTCIEAVERIQARERGCKVGMSDSFFGKGPFVLDVALPQGGTVTSKFGVRWVRGGRGVCDPAKV